MIQMEFEGKGLFDIGHVRSAHQFHFWRCLWTSSLQFTPNNVHYDSPFSIHGHSRLPICIYTSQFSTCFNGFEMERARIHDEHPRDEYHSRSNNDEYRAIDTEGLGLHNKKPGYGHLSGMTKYIHMMQHNAHILASFCFSFLVILHQGSASLMSCI
jgi:hypothetical protein